MRTKKKTNTQKRGFTLIEMAIVLVIIGLIIGAVLKGQDIITNARMKRFTNFVRLGEISQWGYYDRNGKFAKSLGQLNSMSDWMQSNSSLEVGPADFRIFLMQYTNTTQSKVYDGLLILPNDGATIAALEDNDRDAKILEFYKSLDTAIDGSAEGDAGRVRGWLRTTSPSTSGNITSSSASIIGSGAWELDSTTGALYWFDSIP